MEQSKTPKATESQTHRLVEVSHKLQRGYQAPVQAGRKEADDSILPSTHAAVVNSLWESLRQEVLHPIIVCVNQDECWKLVEAALPEFNKIDQAIQVIFSLYVTKDNKERLNEEANNWWAEKLSAYGQEFFGESGESEVRFCLSTYRAAIGAARLLTSIGRPPRDPERDVQLIDEFAFSLNLHSFSSCLLFECGKGKGTAACAEVAIEGMRDGALSAYVAIREAQSLRSPEPEAVPEGAALLWDEEDESLATAEPGSH